MLNFETEYEIQTTMTKDLSKGLRPISRSGSRTSRADDSSTIELSIARNG
jgi:hypothetical protein